MANDIRDLVEWYPFIPNAAALPAFVANVVDLKVDVSLLSFDLNGAFDRVTLTSVDTDDRIAMVRVWSSIDDHGMFGDHGYMELAIAVYTVDESVDVADGYIVMKELMAWSGDPLEIHPDCVVFKPYVPMLILQNRGPVNSDDVPADDPVDVPVGDYIFVNGYNTLVEWRNNGVMFTGGSRLGLGVYTEPPYSNQVTYATKPNVGLRSINGATEAVGVTGTTTMPVSTTGSSISVRCPSNEA